LPFLILTIFSALFLPALALGQTFQPVVRPLGDVDKVIVRGYKGKLQIVGTQGDEVRVEARKIGGDRFDSSNFQLRGQGRQLEILVKGPSETEDWEKLRSGANFPEFEMKITLPPKSLEIFWAQGQVVADSFPADLSVQMTEGDVHVGAGKGHLMLQLIKGRGKVLKHEGPIDIQSFNGQFTLSQSQGSLTVNNHSANYSISQHKGPLEIRNHSGSIKVVDMQGTVTLKNVSGVVSLDKIQGSLSGDVNGGRLDAKFDSLQSFSLASEKGVVHLEAPKDSGALVSLRSEKGQMYAPIHLRKQRRGRWTERKGQLKGQEQGNIKIVSKYGDIVLK